MSTSLAVTDYGLAVADDSCGLRLMGFRTHCVLWQVKTPNSPGEVRWNATTRTLAVECPTQIVFYSLATRKPVATLRPPSGSYCESLAFSPNRRKIASKSGKTIMLWNWRVSSKPRVTQFGKGTFRLRSLRILHDSFARVAMIRSFSMRVAYERSLRLRSSKGKSTEPTSPTQKTLSTLSPLILVEKPRSLCTATQGSPASQWPTRS